jgi:hypothetical protein
MSSPKENNLLDLVENVDKEGGELPPGPAARPDMVSFNPNTNNN